ncbi:MAG TPA: ABC transporter permease [Phenylobacterium sp.]|uniref:ABC transporter permease n=1 Tax=Phenylobacterium sp. TaxID=1871053 RepID=UPI002D5B4552|nr:ABC transporter permease [Phenylobacterium sp.]HZZ67514.1 ABC transporter permease [Phenylobacterium sp.]
MNAMLLVAAREFRQICATRSFLIVLLLLPMVFVVSQLSVRLLQPPPGVAVVIVDASGRYAPVVQQRFALDRDRQALAGLAAYAERWKIVPTGPGAVWGHGAHLFSPQEILAFEAAGGLPAAQGEIARLKPAAAPAFQPPAASVIPIPPPPGVVTTQGPDAFGTSLAPHLKKNVATPVGPRPLGLGVYIPADFGSPGATVRMWTDGRPNALLVEAVRQELSGIERSQALRAAGFDMAALARIQAINAPIVLIAPPSGAGRAWVLLHSALPLALAYLLLISLMMSGSWMLQGLIEERSNKLLESVLACVTPDELLYGKLIGVLAVGMVMIAVWIGFAVGAAFSVQGVVSDFLRPALVSVSSPWVIAALVYYFLAGYLAISMLFLAVGAVSDSLRDAQGYLTPIILVIALPFAAIASSVLQNPDGPLPRILSWIPIYAPFAMMARLGSGVAPIEVIGSGLLLAAFIAVELVLVSRLFRASLLQSGQALGLSALLRRRAA